LFYNVGMKNAQTVCITMPRDFVAKAQKLAARESRTMSELIREALRRYMAEGARNDASGEKRAAEESATTARSSDVIHSFRMEKK
jgi:metal-responsive CopG/Arc/MetJ family transcriptional regulator